MMSVEAVKERKQKLSRELVEVIQNFERDTGTEIHNIDLFRLERNELGVDNSSFLATVELEVKIP